MSVHKNFLDDEEVLTIRPQFAVLLGLNESIVVQQLHYWLKKAEKGKCGRFVHGHYWIWNDIPDWLEQFPFFSASTLKRIFSKLKKDEIVHVEQFDGSDRTNFYRINYENLDKFLENAQKSHEVKMTPCGNDPLEEVNLTPSSAQNELFLRTENTSKNTSEDNNPPLTPKAKRQGGYKLNPPTLSQIADQHRMTISTIEDFLDFRKNSGGINTPDAFIKHIKRELFGPYSDESVQLEKWFEAFETQMNVIDYLVDQFLSTQRFDRRFCRELANDDFTLKANNIVASDVLIEIAYQKAEAKRRERIGGVA